MTRAFVTAGAVALLAVAACVSCGLFGDDAAEAAPPPTTQPATPPPVQPATAAPAAPAQPGTPTPAGGPPAGGQTIELPGLGSITLNMGTGPGAAGGGPAGTGGGSTAPATPRTKVPPTPPPPHGITPTGGLAPAFMQAETRAIHQALVAALPEAQRTRIAGIPLDIVNEPREPNAAAACTRATKRPVMIITTAMITLAGGIAESRAYDELASTNTYETYAQQVVSQLRGRQAVTGVPPGMITGPMARDSRKLARERQLFQEQIAFILGHELAHHHRGHNSCVSSGDASRASAEELARVASSAIPTFTQPLEVEADMWAVYTVLAAGNGRAGGSWDEEGGLVNLEFFSRLRDLGGTDVLQVFLGTHPLPQLRRPIIETAARQWSPGQWPPGSPLGTGLPMPGGGTMPIPSIPGLTAP